MIPQEEADGLLAEANEAEKNGGFVLLTPEYTRHIVGLLTGAWGKQNNDVPIAHNEPTPPVYSAENHEPHPY